MRNKDIKPRNNKGQQHGLWEYYYHNGDLMCKRFYHNGKLVGYNEWYSHNGKLEEKRYYI